MPVAPVEHVPDVNKTSDVEVTRTFEKVIIIEESRQEEARLSKFTLDQRAPPSERDEGDGWFTLFDAIHEKPVVIPPGTLYPKDSPICPL